MKKIALILTGIIVVLVIGSIIIANRKSPNSDKNLLSYWWYHSESMDCRILSQEYDSVTTYDAECDRKKCEEETRNSGGTISFCDLIPNNNGVVYQSKYEECALPNKVQVPKYPERNGQEIRSFHLGIPILKTSCPSGYTVRN